MKFNIADIVEHPSYGVGIVVERCMSASGVNELYSGSVQPSSFK